MYFQFISRSVWGIFASATLALILIFLTFFSLEPTVGRAIATNIKQTQVVNAEISFLATSSITMLPQIAGITGGNSSGSSTVRVLTNNTTGYNITIAFSSTTAMTRNGAGGSIRNYNPTTINVPDFTFANEVFGQFAYTIRASTTADMDQSFKDSGAACNTSTADAPTKCWLNPSTTAKTIVNRTTATLASGATTTIGFRVNIPSNPVPSIQQGTYVATATLTAVVNP